MRIMGATLGAIFKTKPYSLNLKIIEIGPLRLGLRKLFIAWLFCIKFQNSLTEIMEKLIMQSLLFNYFIQTFFNSLTPSQIKYLPSIQHCVKQWNYNRFSLCLTIEYCLRSDIEKSQCTDLYCQRLATCQINQVCGTCIQIKTHKHRHWKDPSIMRQGRQDNRIKPNIII